MSPFLIAPENLPFLVAFGLIAGIGLLEVVSLLVGVSLSRAVDDVLPDLDPDVDLDVELDADLDLDLDVGVDVDADADLELDAASGGSAPALLDEVHAVAPRRRGPLWSALRWLRVGQVPLLALLLIFLLGFGTTGWIVQAAAVVWLGDLIPGSLASFAALAGGLASVHVLGGALARLMPKIDTEVVSQRTFIGQVATITLGTASKGRPAQARLRDIYGRTHYVMVEPYRETEVLTAGSDVLIVRGEGALFTAIPSEGSDDESGTPSST